MDKLSFTPHFVCSFTALAPSRCYEQTQSRIMSVWCSCASLSSWAIFVTLINSPDLVIFIWWHQKSLFKKETTLYCLCSQPRRIQGIATHLLMVLIFFLSIPRCRAFSEWDHWFDSTTVELKQITWQKTRKPTPEFLSSGSALGLDKQTNKSLICLISFGVIFNRLPRTASSQVLSISKDWSSTTSLGNQFHCLTTS